MIKIQGSILKEQGVTFAIVIVKKHIVDSIQQSRETIERFMPLFPGMPVVLMAQDSRGVPSYTGRPDIVEFLANIHISQIPWKEYTFS